MHLAHIIVDFRTLTLVDWMHHLLSSILVGVLNIYYTYGPLLNYAMCFATGRSKSPPLATEHLLENTDGVGAPPSVFSRGGTQWSAVQWSAVQCARARRWTRVSFLNVLEGMLGCYGYGFLPFVLTFVLSVHADVDTHAQDSLVGSTTSCSSA